MHESETPVSQTASDIGASQLRCIACRELIEPEARICPHCHSYQAPWIKLVTELLKWLGAATAIISLVLATYQLHGIWSDIQQKTEAVAELIGAAELQVETGNLETALNLVGEALQLNPASRLARNQQVAITMARVRSIDVFSRFSLDVDHEAIAPLLPILYRGAVSQDKTRGADALAHIAWVYYALTEFGYPAADVDSYFKRALERDPQNSYVHAFRAARCLAPKNRVQCGDKLKNAQKYFETALKRNGTREFVTQLWIESLAHSNIAGARLEAILVANRLRLQLPNLPSELKLVIYDLLIDEFIVGDLFNDLDDKLSPRDALTTFSWLAQEIAVNGSRSQKIRHDIAQATLYNFAGQKAKALALLKPLRPRARYRTRLELRTDRDTYRTFEDVHDKIDIEILHALNLQRGWLAIEGELVSGDVARSLGVTGAQPLGLLVQNITSGSAAKKSGISPGDVIVEVNHRPLSFGNRMEDVLSTTVAGETVQVIVVRNGEQQEVQAVLDEGKYEHGLERLIDQRLYPTVELTWQGREVMLTDLTSELRGALGLEPSVKGAFVVDAKSSDISEPAVIMAVEDRPILTSRDAVRRITELRNARQESARLLVLDLPIGGFEKSGWRQHTIVIDLSLE